MISSPYPIIYDDDIARDEFGIIVQRDGDGGDSLHRMGVELCAYAFQRKDEYVIDRVKLILAKLSNGGAIFIRYWREPYNDPRTVSRDQLIPIIIGLGWAKEILPEADVALRVLCDDIATHLMFAPNVRALNTGKLKIPDWFGFHTSVLIRARFKDGGFLRMILNITDIGLLLGTVFKVLIPIRWNDGKKWFERISPDEADDWNEVLQHIQAYNNMSTVWSWAARFIYGRFRRVTFGTLDLHEPNVIYGALCWYNRSQSGGNPGLAKLWEAPVKALFPRCYG